MNGLSGYQQHFMHALKWFGLGMAGVVEWE